ncbi:MAG: LysM peptidoglycan-binding domain-containing M23 family metallopeptidase [Candidatus Omnitrophota bacterium]
MVKRRVTVNSCVIALCCLILLAGCATVSYPPPFDARQGAYHVVQKNETLWAISKTYGVSLNEIVAANRLPAADEIEVGQRIFIPGKCKQTAKAGTVRPPRDEDFIWPVKGSVIVPFGATKGASKNQGIDIKAAYGASVVAARSGRVSYSTDTLKGYGRTIIIDHDGGYQTVYAYNSQNLVKSGDYVGQNQVIAKAGQGGRAKEPCLHFEIRKEHESQNPFFYLP